MYIILQHIFMFVSQEIRLGACCWHVLPSGSGARYQKLLDVASMACLARRLGGWMPQNYSMLTHVKTGGKKKFYTACHYFWILYSKSWNLDSRLGGCGTRVIDSLFFKFLEDKDQKIED